MPTLHRLYAEANCLYLWKVLCKPCKYKKYINATCRFTICFYLIWINFGLCTFHKPCLKLVFFFFKISLSSKVLIEETSFKGWLNSLPHRVGVNGVMSGQFQKTVSQLLSPFIWWHTDLSYWARGSEDASPSLWILWSY